MCFPLLLFVSSTTLVAEDTSKVLTNIDSQAKLVESITEQIIDRSLIRREDGLAVLFEPMENSWVVHNTVLRTLQSSGYRVLIPDSGLANQVMEIGGIQFRVEYSELHRDGFLGAKKVKRYVSVKLDCRVYDKNTGIYRMNDSLAEVMVDTVVVEKISSLESDGNKATQGVIPADDMLDKIVEPFIILGTTGIAIYLLFNIRSS